MAHSKSAKKCIRQSENSRLRNRARKSSLRTAVKKFETTLKGGDATAGTAALKDVQKKLDKAVSAGVLRRGTVSRMKSRLAVRLNKSAAKK